MFRESLPQTSLRGGRRAGVQGCCEHPELLEASHSGNWIRCGQMVGLVYEDGRLEFCYQHLKAAGEPQIGRGRICGRGNALEDDLRFLGFKLCRVDTGSLLQVGEGFELSDLFAMGEEGSGL